MVKWCKKKNAFYTVDMELMESSSYLVKRYRRAKEAAEKKKPLTEAKTQAWK